MAPATWDFEASAPCGTIPDPSLQIASDASGRAIGRISSSGAYECEMTVTWQSVDGWMAEGGSSHTPGDSSANAGEFRHIEFVMTPS